MITKEKIQEKYLKQNEFSYMNPMLANIDYVKWLETELINAKKQLPINGVVKSLKDKKTISFGLWQIKSKDVEAVNRTLWAYKGVLKNNEELRQIYDEIKHTL
jgi:hypothetical protein